MKIIALTLLLASIYSATALAATPVGLWRGKQYDAVTKNYRNEGDWCFLSDGRVYPVAVGGWLGVPNGADFFFGVWRRSGDTVFMSGERLAEPEVWWRVANIVTRTTMTGSGATWVSGSLASNVNVTVIWTYKGPCSP
jgi:hypothetical protein